MAEATPTTAVDRVNEIEKVMLPLRQQYQSLRRERNYEGMETMKSAVCRALETTPKPTEK